MDSRIERILELAKAIEYAQSIPKVSPGTVAKFLKIVDLTKTLAVSFSLHYCESDDTWYWIISSAAKGEAFIGKNRESFDLATDDVLEHLDTLIAKLVALRGKT